MRIGLAMPDSGPPSALAALLRNIPGEIYRCRNDRDWTMEYVSDGVLGLTGYAADEFLSGRVKYGDLMLPADRERVWQSVQTALAARLSFTLEYRICTADGAEKWIWERGSGAYGPDGGLIALDGFITDVTERKRAQLAAAENEDRYRKLIDLSPDAIFVHSDWRIVLVNQAMLRLFRAESAERLVGREVLELIAPESRETVRARIRQIYEEGLPARPTEVSYLRADGTCFSAEAMAAAFVYAGRPAAQVVARDITERIVAEQQARVAERQARAADERLRHAIEHLNESVAVMDAEDRIVVANRYFRELNGGTHLVEPGRLYEEHLRAGIPLGNYPEAAGREEEWLQARLARHRAGGTIEVQRQDGKWLQVTDQRLPDGGMISFALDITARKRAAEALRDVNADLERRVAERTAALQTAYRELESFSYSVSHDLRSPLGVIASFAGILARQEAGRISEDGMRLVSVIDANAQRMGRLIDALLELMRTSRRALAFGRLDIAGIAAATCRELQREYPLARIEIGELPAAQGDEMLIRQVYANLVGNALKFSSKATPQTVEVGAEAGAAAPVYFVRDNGAGFDTTHAMKLFKPFERLHSEDEFPGTGIGLALVQLIVQRHGGRVWAESAPGRGSTFRFTLAQEGPGTLAAGGSG